MTRVLEERVAVDGRKQYLVSWADGHEDSWVSKDDVSPSLLQDYAEGMEVSPVKAVVDMVQVRICLQTLATSLSLPPFHSRAQPCHGQGSLGSGRSLIHEAPQQHRQAPQPSHLKELHVQG